MLFKYNENYEVELESANLANRKLPDNWQKMIDDHHKEIEEINALEPEHREEIRQSILKTVLAYHPDSPASEIASGVLNYTSEPYRQYIKEQSKKWTFDSSDLILKKNNERYETEMDDYIEKQTFDTKFGRYYANIKTFDLDTEGSTYNTFTHNHKVNFLGKVRSHLSKEEEVLKDDKVGMQDFLNDQKPEYIKQLHHRTKKDGEDTYSNIVEEFGSRQHFPSIVSVSGILGD